MWIWWIISLVVLIACFIFSYKMIMSSYDWLPADRSNFPGFKKKFSASSPAPRSEAIYELKSKLQRVEENSSFYEIQFSKMQERLKILEGKYEANQDSFISANREEEDWKELYYEENERKEKLENELDDTRARLEEMEARFNEAEQNTGAWAELKSDYDARLHELTTSHESISLLQKQLQAAVEREKELELSLVSEINEKKKLLNLEAENIRLRIENEDLKNQIVQTHLQQKEMEIRIATLNELESRLALLEEEKAKMISSLEMVVNATKINLGK